MKSHPTLTVSEFFSRYVGSAYCKMLLTFLKMLFKLFLVFLHSWSSTSKHSCCKRFKSFWRHNMIFHFIIPSLPFLRKNQHWSLTFPGIDFAFNVSGRYFLCLLYFLPNEGRELGNIILPYFNYFPVKSIGVVSIQYVL